MVKNMSATNFNESPLPVEKVRLGLPGANKTCIQAEQLFHVYFDGFFDNNVVENNLKIFRYF